jgi:hypothetical protein
MRLEPVLLRFEEWSLAELSTRSMHRFEEGVQQYSIIRGFIYENMCQDQRMSHGMIEKGTEPAD